MKLFDAGQHATGFIAVGQEATGFFAFGQVATGVIAVGQMARGGIAIGQVAFGLIGWGQAGVGMFHAVGMLGVGGRGFGGVLRLVPSIGRPRELPAVTTVAAIASAQHGERGWIEVDLTPELGFEQGGARLPIKLDRALQRGAREITAQGKRRVLASTRRVGPLLVCDRIAFEPPRPYQEKGFALIAGLQLIALLGLGTAYAALVGHELVPALARIVADAPAATVRPPVTAPAPRTQRPRSR